MNSNTVSEITWEEKVYSKYIKFYCIYFDDLKRKQLKLEENEKEKLLSEALRYINEEDQAEMMDLYSNYRSVSNKMLKNFVSKK
jgi:hypothetical protein